MSVLMLHAVLFFPRIYCMSDRELVEQDNAVSVSALTLVTVSSIIQTLPYSPRSHVYTLICCLVACWICSYPVSMAIFLCTWQTITITWYMALAGIAAFHSLFWVLRSRAHAVNAVTPDRAPVQQHVAVVMLLQFWMIHMRGQTAIFSLSQLFSKWEMSPTAAAGAGLRGYKFKELWLFVPLV